MYEFAYNHRKPELLLYDVPQTLFSHLQPGHDLVGLISQLVRVVLQSPARGKHLNSSGHIYSESSYSFTFSLTIFNLSTLNTNSLPALFDTFPFHFISPLDSLPYSPNQ